MQEYKIKSTGFEMYKSTKAQYYMCLELQDYRSKGLQVYGSTGKQDMYSCEDSIILVNVSTNLAEIHEYSQV